MDMLYILGIAIVLWLQSLGMWLLGPMIFFTNLGYEQFYMLVAPLLFWNINPSLGLRAGVGLMISNGIIDILKISFHGARPYWYDPRVPALSSEPSFGAPSSHAQNAVVFWGLAANHSKRAWTWLAAILLILLISISRIYLGVHFPMDVLIGWLFGVGVLLLMIRYERPVLAWFREKQPWMQIGLVLAVSLVMMAASYLVRLALRSWTLPESWVTLAGRAGPIDPLAFSGGITAAATFSGLAIGGILLFRNGWMDARGTVWQHIARYLLGLVGVVAIWYGLDQIFPEGDNFVAYLARFIRYGLVGLWVSYLAPRIFIRFGLAKPEYSMAARDDDERGTRS